MFDPIRVIHDCLCDAMSVLPPGKAFEAFARDEAKPRPGLRGLRAALDAENPPGRNIVAQYLSVAEYAAASGISIRAEIAVESLAALRAGDPGDFGPSMERLEAYVRSAALAAGAFRSASRAEPEYGDLIAAAYDLRAALKAARIETPNPSDRTMERIFAEDGAAAILDLIGILAG